MKDRYPKFVAAAAQAASRYHAIAYNTFVISSQSLIDEKVKEKTGIDLEPGESWTAIV